MSKIEIARQSSAAAVAQKTEGMQALMDTLREQHRQTEALLVKLDTTRIETPEQMARAVEPLAASMAVLSDQTRTFLSRATGAVGAMSKRVEQASKTVEDSIRTMGESVKTQALALEHRLGQTQEHVKDSLERLEQAQRPWRTLTASLLGSLLGMALIVACLAWLLPIYWPSLRAAVALERACSAGSEQACSVLRWALSQQ